MNNETYTLKGIKTFNGREGDGYEASLYLGKKKVAWAFNGGDGGCDDYRFVSKEDEKAFSDFCEKWYQTSRAKPEFEKLVGHTGTDHTHYDRALAMELWVAEFIADREEEKLLKRLSRTKTLFRLKGDPVGEWRSCNTVDPRAIPEIQKKHGDQIERIYGRTSLANLATSLN